MVEELRAEIRSLAPSRVVTIGSSMGGYASVRAGIALGADLAIGFSPQVLIDPKARAAASLDHMHFDDLLSWLTVVGAMEGFELTSLVDAAKQAPSSCGTRVELHVGATDAGDVHEAELLVAAIEARSHGRGRRSGSGRDGEARHSAAPCMSASLRVHPNRDHNLVVSLRDTGELHEMLVGWLTTGRSGQGSEQAAYHAPGPALSATGGQREGAKAGRRSPNVATLHSSPAAALGSARKSLAAGNLSQALAEVDASLRLDPLSSAAWAQRGVVLVQMKRYVDAMMGLQVLSRAGVPVTEQATADLANSIMSTCQRSQKEMGTQLAALAQAANESTEAGTKIRQYEQIYSIDPTNVYASFELASQRVTSANELQNKARMRAKGANSAVAVAIAREAHGLLHALRDDIVAYTAEAEHPATPPALAVLKGVASGEKRSVAALDAWLHARRPNCPLPPAQYMKLFNSKLELTLGMACDVVHAACSGGSSGTSIDGARQGGGGGVGSGGDTTDGDGECGSSEGIERSLEHYEVAAALDGSTWEVYDLWHHAIGEHPRYSGQPQAARAAQAKVHSLAVAAGVWGHPMQRPSHYIRGLLAKPWHDANDFAPCRALLAAYRTIRAEALELLHVDAAEARAASSGSQPTGTFCSYLSAVLESGDWADVGLYYNGRRNEANAKRAPETSELLRRNKDLRRDATSCPFGSAYFSLLRPGTRLGAHCGPTNGRLRAHLGLVMPEDEPDGAGELRIVCGDEERRWSEGKVLIFDDSFEHAVWNQTSKPRLVLIVDLWHPMLDTDEKRLAAMNSDEERGIYLGVVKRREYGNTTQRGH